MRPRTYDAPGKAQAYFEQACDAESIPTDAQLKELAKQRKERLDKYSAEIKASEEYIKSKISELRIKPTSMKYMRTIVRGVLGSPNPPVTVFQTIFPATKEPSELYCINGVRVETETDNTSIPKGRVIFLNLPAYKLPQ
ncbi:hypothetical protein Ddc_13395 [Ditylenchus destructor]|nr:hypothetical protein Ddc_13395 [Ditylenchus destructor]